MKRTIFSLLMLLVSTIYGQEEIYTFCQTIPTSSHMADLEAIRGLDHTDDIFYLKIYVHVLRKETEPKLGHSIEDVNRQLKFLYDDFDPLAIHFVWNGSIDYIENDEFYSNVGDNTSNIFNTNSHTDGIDIYFFDVEEGAPYGFGLANDIGGSAFMVGGSYRGHKGAGELTPYAYRKIISHEMGHVLYLFHTHHGTWVQQHASCPSEDGAGTCPELVDGSNGTTCGDYIADTPADPVIGWQVNYDTDCAYAPTLDPNDCIPDSDANGDLFQPDATNLMSYTYPTCLQGFTLGQKKRMKNAIFYLPVLSNALLGDYTYIRPLNDCYVCFDNETHFYDIYSSLDIEHLYAFSQENNVETTIISSTSDSFRIQVTSLLGSDGGARSSFSIVNSGRGIIVAHQPIWVGLPETVPDQIVNGAENVNAGEFVYYKIDDGSYRLDGIETYNWEFPQPNEPYVFWGGPPPNNPTVWEYSYFSKYVPKSGNSVGNQTGYVTVAGKNPCGLGDYGDFNQICVENADDPEGDTCTSPIPQPIYYYPNPSDSLLQIDLSLQDYKVFDVVIYDENQQSVYTGQSENVVKTVDVANLSNDTYYLHIYDGGNLILSAILIINH